MNGAQLDQEKLFYERFFALHDDPVMLDVFKQFGIGVFRRSSVLEGFAAFLTQQKITGTRCVEIGTCNGLTALVLSRFFKTVWSVDTVPTATKHAIAAHCGVTNIVFVDVPDNRAKAEFIADLDSFDFAYVDGDHTNDTETDFALVHDCGRVLFHEYWEAQPPVWNLIESLRGQGHVETKGKFALWTKEAN